MTNKHSLTIEQALYHSVTDYPGGAEAVAAIFGWNAQVLRNSLNLHQPAHKPNLMHLKGILEATKDERILDAVGAMADGLFVQVGSVDCELPDDQILSDLLNTVDAVSKYSGVVRKSVADNKVNCDEWLDLQIGAQEAIRKIFVVLKRCEQMREVS